MKRLLVSTAIFLIITTQAMAWCSAPSEPSMYRPSKPVTPFCVNEWAGTHSCDETTINWYNNDIEHYHSNVESYVNKLQRYVNDAIEYANCEARELSN